MSERIRVLVADDSPTARALLVGVLASDPGIEVVGEAHDGAEAIRLAERLRPDLITMDIHMPGVDGIGATRQIMARLPTPILIVTSANSQDVELSLDATAAGALLVVEKPGAPTSPRFPVQSRRLLSMVKAMAAVKVVRRWEAAARKSIEVRVPAPPRVPAKVVAIAASTGGPAALKQILNALPSDFPVPMLLVQHIADGFTTGLVHWLGSESNVAVEVAEDGALPRPATLYVAPHNRHLALAAAGRLEISSSPAIGGFRPSADRLFESVGSACGARAVAVILTGMGVDGVSGLESVRRNRGYVIAQDEATSVVWGMPGEAARRGLVDVVLPLGDIAAALTRLVTPGEP
jgi:two-component system chemotaxis response regulator CheB